MLADHLWGEWWISRADAGKQPLTQLQIAEIRAEHIPPVCESLFSTPAPKTMALSAPPDLAAIERQLTQEKQQFEAEHGSLPPLELNIFPPVFAEQATLVSGQTRMAQTTHTSAVGRYGKSLLSSEEQRLYSVLERMAQEMQPEQMRPVSPPVYPARFTAIWAAWMNDYPQYYWAEPDTILDEMGNVAQVSILVRAPLTLEEVRVRQKEIDAAATELLSGLAGDGATMAYAIHDRLLAATDYVRHTGVDDTANLYGTLVKRRGVCNGLSRAYQYLMQLSGMESIYINGATAWGTTHAWNAVKTDGEWYYVDVTWDRNERNADIFHDYLLVTWEEMAVEHIARSEQYAALPQLDRRVELSDRISKTVIASGITGADGSCELTYVTPLPKKLEGKSPDGVITVYDATGAVIYVDATMSIKPGSTTPQIASKYYAFFFTDRTLYHTTDTIQFWGFVKPHMLNTEPIPQMVRVLFDEEGLEQSIDVRLSADGVFSGEIAIDKVRSSQYKLSTYLYDASKKEEEQLTHLDNIWLEAKDFEKPTFVLTVKPGKKLFVAPDQVEVIGQLNFYDGTPVPNYPLEIEIMNLKDGKVQEVKTVKIDASGTARFLFRADEGIGERMKTGPQESYFTVSLARDGETIRRRGAYTYQAAQIATDVTTDMTGAQQMSLTVRTNRSDPAKASAEALATIVKGFEKKIKIIYI